MSATELTDAQAQAVVEEFNATVEGVVDAFEGFGAFTPGELAESVLQVAFIAACELLVERFDIPPEEACKFVQSAAVRIAEDDGSGGVLQ